MTDFYFCNTASDPVKRRAIGEHRCGVARALHRVTAIGCRNPDPVPKALVKKDTIASLDKNRVHTLNWNLASINFRAMGIEAKDTFLKAQDKCVKTSLP
ncbi:hypothetical protein L596_028701 [Steinernema carpocapsae]|uniref:Uncharacterized protein n=1 Tax=Steinernema carpocapsae TaxID=34508 RepID=A0A4U5LZ61_STECR|nr:hypothetical protein L596_028701 [Steinernema carpocapsae]